MYSYLHDKKHSGQLNNPAKTSIEISEMVPIKDKKGIPRHLFSGDGVIIVSRSWENLLIRVYLMI